MSHRRRSPRPAAATLERLREGWQPNSPLGRAQSAWEQVGRAWPAVVGAHGGYLLERTSLVSLRGGVLTVSCSEAVVADALALEASGLIERLNAHLAGEPLTRLRCVTGEAG